MKEIHARGHMFYELRMKVSFSLKDDKTVSFDLHEKKYISYFPWNFILSKKL